MRRSDMNGVVVVGGGGHARSVIDVASDCLAIAGYVDMQDRGTLAGAPYLGEAEKVLREEDAVLIGVAYGQTPREMIRRRVIEQCKAMGCRFPSLVSSSALVSQWSDVGHGAVVMHRAVVNAGSLVGEFCVVNTASVIEHDCRLGRGVFVGPGVVVSGGVTIGNNAFLGAGAVIRDGVSIGEGVLVAAGAVVVSDLPVPGVYCGIPARPMLSRGATHGE